LIELPIGKAIIAVETNQRNCIYCDLYTSDFLGICTINQCRKEFRKDGKNVIFKLVDYKGERDCENCHVSPDDCDPLDCERAREEN
jgi:hypothetical protein